MFAALGIAVLALAFGNGFNRAPCARIRPCSGTCALIRPRSGSCARTLPRSATCLAMRLGVSAAEVVLSCGPDFAAAMSWLLELGEGDVFRLDEIGPADAPSYARLSGAGLSLRLNNENGSGPLPTLRLQCTSLDVARTLVGPGGVAVELIKVPLSPATRDEKLTLDIPPIVQSLAVSRAADAATWSEGRAGMLYRDLLPERHGGAYVASRIRIPTGGEVPDYVHYHHVRFQVIYCLRGWVRVVYEGAGEPFDLQPGDCILQPPTIRHRVLACSDGLEGECRAAPIRTSAAPSPTSRDLGRTCVDCRAHVRVLWCPLVRDSATRAHSPAVDRSQSSRSAARRSTRPSATT